MVTYGEAFTVQPFGNTLVTMTLTGAQIDTVLEQQFCGMNAAGAAPGPAALGGLPYTWDAAGTARPTAPRRRRRPGARSPSAAWRSTRPPATG